MKLFKRGKVYHLYIDGRRISTRKRTKDEAKDFAKSYRDFSWDKFEEVVFPYFNNNGYNQKSIETFERVYKYLRNILDKEPLELEPLDFERYKAERRSHVSATTLNIELEKIQAMFNVLHKLGIKESRTNIQKVFQPKPQPICFKDEEVDLIIESCPDIIREYVIFALNTGLRLREITNLTRENIEGDYIQIKTTATFKTKCDKARRVPLNSKAKEVLEVVLKGNISPVYLSHSFKQVLRNLGLNEKYHFHTLRKTFATRCARKGMLLYDLMSVLGHSSVKTTEIYFEKSVVEAGKVMEFI